MKVALFGAGDIGLYQLPGEHPERELAEMLGGETEMARIDRRLKLVTRRDGETERLTIRYAIHRLGHEPEPIAGECAVVAVGAEGCLLDMGRHDPSDDGLCYGRRPKRPTGGVTGTRRQRGKSPPRFNRSILRIWGGHLPPRELMEESPCISIAGSVLPGRKSGAGSASGQT